MITHVLGPEALESDPMAQEGAVVEISGDAYRHLFRSRRLAVGAELRLVDGLGFARAGRVTRVERKVAWVEVAEPVASHEAALRLHLFIGALRPERAAWLVEKSTELGVFEVHFMATERTPREYGTGRLERLRRVATAAVEQCHRSRVPRIDGVHSWPEVEGLLPAGERYVLDGSGRPWNPSATGGSPESVADESKSEDVAVLIGPEGGWTGEELERLAGWGVEKIRLGPRVLRVETAAVVASALWLAVAEDRQSDDRSVLG